jgi:hypothetical protein
MPSPKEIERLKGQLTRYIDQVRKACSGGDVEESVRKRLDNRYRELYASYQKISPEEINNHFSSGQIQAINFMSLGMENGIAEFYRETSGFFEKDANRTAIAVAGFMKSRRAYDLVHSQKSGALDPQQMEQLTRMFGSLLGVQVTSEFVKSVRTEELGRIFGYAISGLCERDIGAWQSDEALRKQYGGSVDKYLADVIPKADKQASYRFASDLEETGTFLAAFKINESISAQRGQVRGRNLVDHCFLNANPDGKGGTIILGTSTAENHAEKHGYSFSAAVLAATAMTERKTISGKPNPYYGFKVKTYCFMAGFMPTTTLDGEIERSPIVQMLEKGRTGKSALSLAQVQSIAKLPFLSLFASEDPSPFLSRGLNEINPVVAGCETLADYQTLVNENRTKKTYSSSRKLGVYVLGQVAKVSQLLAQDNSLVEIGEVGPQKVLRSGLETLVGVVRNYGTIFPIKRPHELQVKEKKLLGNIAEDFEVIANKIKLSDSGRGLGIAKTMTLLARSLSTTDKIVTQMLVDGEDVKKFDVDVVHNEDLYGKIDMLGKLYTSKDERKFASRGIADRIRAGNGTEFFRQLLDTTRNAYDLTSEQSKFWADWTQALFHRLDGGTIEKSEREALLKGKAAFTSECEKGPLRNMVMAIDNLIGQKGPAGLSPIVTRLDHHKMKTSVLPNIVKALVAMTRGVDDDEAVGTLRSLVSPPVQASLFSPSRRRP